MSSKVAVTGWRYARSGPISAVLALEKFDLTPAKDQALVKVLSAPMHRTDAAVINGTALGRRRVNMAAFPRIGGCEGVGQVVSAPVGASVKAGDTVWIAPVTGTWATSIAVAPDTLHKIAPGHAALAVNAGNYLAAQHLLQGYARLKKGSAVVQNGGSSVTALAVTALAKPMGVTVLTAATPGERFAGAKQRHEALGGKVFEYNGNGARAMSAALGIKGPLDGAALYLNGVGGKYFDTFFKLVGHGGEVVNYGAQNGFGLFFSGSTFIVKEATMQGFFLPAHLAGLSYGERQTQLDFVLRELAAAKFAYPQAVAASIEKLPEVWDETFVHGGKKAILKIS